MSDEPLKAPAVPDSAAAGEGNAEPTDVPRDRVEPLMIDTERVPQGTLPPERMREVLRRLAEHAYDSVEARDVIARRVEGDLRLPRGSETP